MADYCEYKNRSYVLAFRIFWILRQILYHFDQFGMSQVTGPSVVSKIGRCHRSRRPVLNRSNAWRCWKVKNQLKNRSFYTIYCLFYIFWLSQPSATPWLSTKPLKLPIWALSNVKIFALSQSPAICVEVSNWSNVSQSQGCVELNKMVQ
jgi:hypothetical protein